MKKTTTWAIWTYEKKRGPCDVVSEKSLEAAKRHYGKMKDECACAMLGKKRKTYRKKKNNNYNTQTREERRGKKNFPRKLTVVNANKKHTEKRKK